MSNREQKRRDFGREKAKELGAKTRRAIGKVLAKHDSGVIEVCLELVDEIEALEKRLRDIRSIIESVENRCMAADGPVTNTRDEMTDEELRRIYRLTECKGRE